MFLKTFSFRIMAIAFVGTHIPLLCIVFFCMFGPGKSYAPSEIISVTLLATLAAAMATLILVDKQVRPVRKAAIALVGVEAGTATPTMPESTCRELSQLFSAIHESYQTAQTAQEHKRQVAKKLTSQVSAADQSRQDVLDRLVKNPGPGPERTPDAVQGPASCGYLPDRLHAEHHRRDQRRPASDGIKAQAKMTALTSPS